MQISQTASDELPTRRLAAPDRRAERASGGPAPDVAAFFVSLRTEVSTLCSEKGRERRPD